MTYRFLFLVLVFLGIGPVTISQTVEFFKEDLKFSISENYFKVEGSYYFRNTTDDTIRKFLIYPFPDYLIYGEVDSILIYNKSTGEQDNKLSGINTKGAYFIIVIKPNDIVQYDISYIQKSISNKAKYILTSMQSWRNKLEEASFELSFPVSPCLLDSINFIPQEALLQNDKIIYRWQKTDFMPNKDVDIFLR
jgi:hypothetical protein